LCVFAIAADTAFGQPVLNRVEQLLRRQLANPGAPTEQGYLGLVADDRLDAGRGLRVTSISPGGAAATAGVQVDDLIVEADGRSVRSMDDMAQVITGKPPGMAVGLTLERAGARQQLQVTLGRRTQAPPSARANTEELPSPRVAPNPAPPRLGIRTVDVTDEARQRNKLPASSVGAQVISVAPGSAADRAGIPLGAIIQAVNGRAIDSPQTLALAIRDSAAAQGVELAYVFDGDERRTRVTFATEPTVAARPPAVQAPTPGPPFPGPAAEQPPQQPGFEKPHPRIEAFEVRLREIEARLEKLEARYRRLQPADAAPEEAPKASSDVAPEANP
jgi:membrane-associated protease RseP (regulator of RpoE activity)